MTSGEKFHVVAENRRVLPHARCGLCHLTSRPRTLSQNGSGKGQSNASSQAFLENKRHALLPKYPNRHLDPVPERCFGYQLVLLECPNPFPWCRKRYFAPHLFHLKGQQR